MSRLTSGPFLKGGHLGSEEIRIPTVLQRPIFPWRFQVIITNTFSNHELEIGYFSWHLASRDIFLILYLNTHGFSEFICKQPFTRHGQSAGHTASCCPLGPRSDNSLWFLGDKILVTWLQWRQHQLVQSKYLQYLNVIILSPKDNETSNQSNRTQHS